MNRIYFLFLTLFYFGTIEAQQLTPIVVNSCGGVIKNTNHSLEWSLGEIAVNTITSSVNILTQGFLQPMTTMVNTKNLGSDLSIKYYPNPVINELNLVIVEQDIKTIQIHDLLGKLILKSPFAKNISLQDIHSGIYMITLIDNHKQIISSFKINKI